MSLSVKLPSADPLLSLSLCASSDLRTRKAHRRSPRPHSTRGLPSPTPPSAFPPDRKRDNAWGLPAASFFFSFSSSFFLHVFPTRPPTSPQCMPSLVPHSAGAADHTTSMTDGKQGGGVEAAKKGRRLIAAAPPAPPRLPSRARRTGRPCPASLETRTRQGQVQSSSLPFLAEKGVASGDLGARCGGRSGRANGGPLVCAAAHRPRLSHAAFLFHSQPM